MLNKTVVIFSIEVCIKYHEKFHTIKNTHFLGLEKIEIIF